MAKTDRFWTGKITAQSHASKVVRYMVGTLGVVTALLALTLLTGPDISKVLSIILFGALALSLHRTRSPIVAGILLVIVGGLAAAALAAGLSLVAQGGSAGWGLVGVALLWVGFAIGCWRTLTAARVLRRLERTAARPAVG